MATRKTVFVTKANEDSPAFGITADTDETVFISHAQAAAAELEVGDELIAVVKENDHPERAKWFAVAVKRVDDDADGDEA
jgi:hypothetical protein